jgi:hypothetical protein
MASQISYKDQFFYVSNMRFASLIDFALEVGKNSAQTDAEKSYVSKLKEDSDAFFPGYDFAIEREFPSCDERKFWVRIFFDLAYLIFAEKSESKKPHFGNILRSEILICSAE